VFLLSGATACTYILALQFAFNKLNADDDDVLRLQDGNSTPELTPTATVDTLLENSKGRRTLTQCDGDLLRASTGKPMLLIVALERYLR